MAVALAISSLLFYMVAGYCGGMAARRGGAIPAVMVSQVVAAGLFFCLLLVFPLNRAVGSDYLFGLAAGLIGVVGLICYYFAMEKGSLSVVAPLAGACNALEPALFGWAKGEPITFTGVLGVILVVAAIALLGRGKNTEGRATPTKIIGLAILTGVLFGSIFICIAQIHAVAGPGPLIAIRVSGMLLILGIAASTGRLRIPLKGALALASVAGVTLVFGDLSYFYGVKQGAVSVVAVIAALNPAAVGALGLVLLRERFRPMQLAGFGSAIGGIVLLSAG